MRLFIEKALRKSYNLLYPYSRVSYSQNGEDLIIKDLFYKLGVKKPTYLDIGANEPYYLSNTYLFYSKGCHGVCVEPNYYLYKKFKSQRKRDICINAGVAFDERTEADFYLFPKNANGLGTFSKEEAQFWETKGNSAIGKHRVEKILKVRLVNINDIIKQNFEGGPNLISLDVEGLDLKILQLLDFNTYKPEVLCVETLEYSENDREEKNQHIIDFLCTQGYFVYADTYINTIFCRQSVYPGKA
jgi:FkbM family methyltransferase